MEKLNLRSLKLLVGAHEKREEGLCAMEAVAWLAGEPHSDAPVCACPVVTKYVIGLNDKFNDNERKLLKPYLKRIIGTRDGNAVKRAEILALNVVTRVAPYAIEIKFPKDAEKMRAATNLENAKAAAAAATDSAAYAATAADAAYAAYTADLAAATAADAAYAAADSAADAVVATYAAADSARSATTAYATAATAAYATAAAATTVSTTAYATAASAAAYAAYATATATAATTAYDATAIRSKIVKAALQSLDEILKVK